MENIEQAQVPSQDVGGEQAPAQPELNIADLQNIRAVIDTAVRRGAFGAAEATAVGSVFDRLNTFLTAVAPAQTSAEQPAPTAE
jgi:hypothetical protein